MKGDKSPELDDKETNIIQQVVGICLYYDRAFDDILLPVLGSRASEQTKATTKIIEKVVQLLDYLPAHSDVVVIFMHRA